MDDDHTMVLFDWCDGSVKSVAKTGKPKPFALRFAPRGSPFQLVHAAKKSIGFWKGKGRNLAMQKAVLGKKGVWQPMMSLGVIDSDVVVGTFDGHLYRFSGHKLQVTVKAHNGQCTL